MVVLDASVVLELLLNRPLAQRISARILHPRETLHAPHLLDAEVLQVLRRYNRNGELTDWRAEEAIGMHLSLPIERYPHEPLAFPMWQWRANVTAYDAAYLALAEMLSAPLLTTDAWLVRSSPAARRITELIA